MSRPRTLPWHSSTSVRAGLPTVRAAWLDRVLPTVRAEPTDVRIAATLGVPRTTWATWRAWLAGELAAGRLPEWGADPWPAPILGARAGAPLRGGARIRHEAAEARRAANARNQGVVSG